VIAAPLRQRVVEQAVPCGAAFDVEAVPEDVGPGTDDLQVDVLLVEPFDPLSHGLDQAREERPYLEPVVKLKRRRSAVHRQKPNAQPAAVCRDGVEELGWHEMGMGVDGQGVPRSQPREHSSRASEKADTISCWR